MAYKELFPVVVAVALWGLQWSSKQVEFFSDNTAVVEVLRSGTSRDPNLMALLRHISLLTECHSFSFTATHVAGKLNPVADALSSFNFQKFHRLAPHVAPEAMENPGDLLDLLQPLQPRNAISTSQMVLLLQLHSTSNRTSLRVHIRCSKTDRFHQGCFIYLGRGHSLICPIAAVMAYLHIRGLTPGPLFVHQDGQPCLPRSCPTFFSQHYLQLGYLDPSPVTASELGRPPRQPSRVFQII